MPNLDFFLENDKHLMPLLCAYLSYLNPALKNKVRATEEDLFKNSTLTLSEDAVFGEEDYSCIQNPDGSISAFRMDVYAQKEAGGNNIRDGYWRTIASALKANLSPHTLRILSIITDGKNSHWTTSVTEITLEEDLFFFLQAQFTQRTLRTLTLSQLETAIDNVLKKEKKITKGLSENKLWGARSITLFHYDSLYPNLPGDYFYTYRRTLAHWIKDNQKACKPITVLPGRCQKQKGSTCGDHTLYNAFMAGVLGLNPFPSLDSKALRAYSEWTFGQGDPRDAEMVKSVQKHIQQQLQTAYTLKRQAPSSLPPSVSSRNRQQRGERASKRKQKILPMKETLSAPPKKKRIR